MSANNLTGRDFLKTSAAWASILAIGGLTPDTVLLLLHLDAELSSKTGGSYSPVFEPERSRALAGAMLELRRKMKLILIADFNANLFNGKGRMKEQRPGGVHLHPNEKR